MTATVSPPQNKRTVGRPRCPIARQAILDATVRLLETCCVKSLAIECIAREAGVGKATIYRWWPNKPAVVIDAFFERVVETSMAQIAETGAVAIAREVGYLVDVLNAKQGQIAAQIIAEGQFDPSVLENFRCAFLTHRRAALQRSIEGGIAGGEFRDDIAIDVAIDMIYGSIWYRLLATHEPLDHHFVNNLIKMSLATLAHKP